MSAPVELVRCAYGAHDFPAADASPRYTGPVCPACARDIASWGCD